MKFLLELILCVILLSGCQKPTERDWEFASVGALFEDQAATALIKAERFEDALSIYLHMLEQEPNKPQIHSNIAVIMAQTQKLDEAVKSWRHALKLAEEQKDGAALFAVNFNLGAYYGSQKKIEEALTHYQAALEIVPTSIETKTNIELLVQTQNQNGQGDSQNKDQNQQQNQNQDQNKNQQDQNGPQKKDSKEPPQDQSGKDDPKKQDEKEKPSEKDKQKEQPKKMQSSAKYKPRPYQGDQLNEGDVKKILGELRNQEQKIRANFDKKEQKDSKNEKDW